jgi:hypothetical protein
MQDKTKLLVVDDNPAFKITKKLCDLTGLLKQLDFPVV